jgi:glutathione S-transferase
MYLGEVFGVDAKLYPASGSKRGEAMKWIAWSNVTLAEPARVRG